MSYAFFGLVILVGLLICLIWRRVSKEASSLGLTSGPPEPKEEKEKKPC